MAELDSQKYAEATRAAVQESTDRCIGEKTLNVGAEGTGFRSGTNRLSL